MTWHAVMEIILTGKLTARVSRKYDYPLGGKTVNEVSNESGRDLICVNKMESGRSLTDMCDQKSLITNGFFWHKNIHKFAWTQEA